MYPHPACGITFPLGMRRRQGKGAAIDSRPNHSGCHRFLNRNPAPDLDFSAALEGRVRARQVINFTTNKVFPQSSSGQSPRASAEVDWLDLFVSFVSFCGILQGSLAPGRMSQWMPSTSLSSWKLIKRGAKICWVARLDSRSVLTRSQSLGLRPGYSPICRKNLRSSTRSSSFKHSRLTVTCPTSVSPMMRAWSSSKCSSLLNHAAPRAGP